MFIRTRRLTLRPPWLCDAPAIVALANNWNVARQLGRLPHPYGPEDAAFFLREIVPAEHIVAITSADDGTLMGFAGFTDHGAAWELGYWLGEPFWGQGFATEAAAALLDAAVYSFGRALFTSAHFLDNPASCRVLTKLGFQPTHQALRPNLASGTQKPAREMALTAQQWRARREQVRIGV
jgi:RimJ/RimL family protein N-acetyltransferase